MKIWYKPRISKSNTKTNIDRSSTKTRTFESSIKISIRRLLARINLVLKLE